MIGQLQPIVIALVERGNIRPDNHSGALSRPSSRYPAGRHS